MPLFPTIRLRELAQHCPTARCGQETVREFTIDTKDYRVFVRNWCGGHFEQTGHLDDRDIQAIAGMLCLRAHQRIVDGVSSAGESID